MNGRSVLIAGSCLAFCLNSMGCGGSAPVPMSIDGNSGKAPAADRSAGEFAASERWLIGAWDGKIELTADLPADQFPEIDRSQLESMRISLTFRDDGIVSMDSSVQLPDSVQTASSEARWEVVRANAISLTIRSTEPEMAPEEIELRLDGERSFTTPLPDEQGDIGHIRFIRR